MPGGQTTITQSAPRFHPSGVRITGIAVKRPVLEGQFHILEISRRDNENGAQVFLFLRNNSSIFIDVNGEIKRGGLNDIQVGNTVIAYPNGIIPATSPLELTPAEIVLVR